MTAPGSGEQITAELAEALPHFSGCLALYPPASTTIARTGPCTCWGLRQASAAALLPVVEAYATRKAAEELRAAAEWAFEQSDGYGTYSPVVNHLEDRADVLDPPL